MKLNDLVLGDSEERTHGLAKNPRDLLRQKGWMAWSTVLGEGSIVRKLEEATSPASGSLSAQALEAALLRDPRCRERAGTCWSFCSHLSHGICKRHTAHSRPYYLLSFGVDVIQTREVIK